MAERIRVLFSIGSLAGGGSERQVLTLLRHLDRTRFKPLLYLIYRAGELLADVPADTEVFAFDDTARRPRWYIPGLAHRMRVRDMSRVLREQQVDVAYDRTFHMTLIAGPATQRAQVPRISVAVTNPAQDVIPGLERFAAVKRRLLSHWYSRAFCVAAVSEGVRRGLIERYQIAPDKVKTIYNPVDTERVRALALEKIPDFEPGHFHIVTGGRLHWMKGQLHLLQAVDELVHRRNRSDLLLHFVGSGPQEEELRVFVDEKQLNPFVRFHGFQANPFAFYARAQLFCLPSLIEGMPNALLEAMACGVPVIASNCESGPREILADGQYGRLVPPGDSAALAGAIEDAMANYPVFQATAETARSYVEQRFSIAAGLRPLEELLLQAAGRQL